MEKKNLSIKKMITILLVLAVLIMALPMTVVAKGNKGKGNAYGHSKIKVDQEDELEPTEDEEEEEDSERSLFVAARNKWAKENGIPPGHANLLYKYIVATMKPDDQALTSENLDESFKPFYDNFLATIADPETETHSVKAFRDFIKGLVITLSGTAEVVLVV